MSTELPAIVAEYIDAVNELDTDRIVATYDKTNLPQDFVMTSYFSVRDDKIASLAVIFNQPSPY